eukprot:3779503-Pyramimonas_sp.AAC.1
MQTSKGIMPRPACMLPRDDATSGHDSESNVLSSSIGWTCKQDFKDKHTTRRLVHLDNDTFIQDHEL